MTRATFHFPRPIEPKVSRIEVSSDQVILSVLAALEFLHTAFYQTLVHVLLLGHDLEERVMPLQDVNIQEMCRGKRALAEGADVPVQRVVVVLVALQCVKDLAAP